MLVLLSTVTHSVLPDYTDLASLPIHIEQRCVLCTSRIEMRLRYPVIRALDYDVQSFNETP